MQKSINPSIGGIDAPNSPNILRSMPETKKVREKTPFLFMSPKKKTAMTAFAFETIKELCQETHQSDGHSDSSVDAGEPVLDPFDTDENGRENADSLASSDDKRDSNDLTVAIRSLRSETKQLTPQTEERQIENSFPQGLAKLSSKFKCHPFILQLNASHLAATESKRQEPIAYSVEDDCLSVTNDLDRPRPDLSKLSKWTTTR